MTYQWQLISLMATCLRHPIITVTALCLLLFYCRPGLPDSLPLNFKLYIEDSGVYQVSYDELQAAGLPATDFRSANISLSNIGKPVPLRIEDGGDGRFGEGDRFIFIGQHLVGEQSYFNDHTSANVYQLRFNDNDAARQQTRMQDGMALQQTALRGPARRLSIHNHIEQDNLRLRFRADPEGRLPEIWYWRKLAHIDRKPFRYQLRLPGLMPQSSQAVKLKLHLRGWSKPRIKPDATVPDHVVEIHLNGELLGTAKWNEQEEYHFSHSIPASRLHPRKNLLELKVPVRRPGGSKNPLVDVSMLNWIEVEYPRKPRVYQRQARIQLAADEVSRPVFLKSAQPFTVYDNAGHWYDSIDVQQRGKADHYRFQLVSGASEFWLAPQEMMRSVLAIVRDKPSNLREKIHQADYIMVTHRKLRGAIEPLARFHQERGLNVNVVDIDDIYDEFNHGIRHPRALRDFLKFAYHHWSPPSPRFVLLVGDASWDSKHQKVKDANYADWTFQPHYKPRLVKNGSTQYPRKAEINHRNLIPSYGFGTYQGLAASDNWFVSVSGDDFYPDMAIGRLPVTDPNEVTAIVDKTIRHITTASVGPWRRNVLWVTDEHPIYQQRSDQLSSKLALAGFSSNKVYPQKNEPNNIDHQDRLRQAFDKGQLLVHFIGHGGRYIWRTGPPDPKKNHDLFTLDDLDKLKPNARLPVVLAMTCYSAPFDHPSADSIGEKFLRIADRGAVAVFAASWRNAPDWRLSESLMQAFATPGTIGEAVMRAKSEIPSRILVETYNLLGDPAVPFVPPQLPIKLASSEQYESGAITVTAAIDAEHFQGQALVDWLDTEGNVVTSREYQVTAPRFAARLAADKQTLERIVQVRVYIWNEAQQIDGMTGLLLKAQNSVMGTGA